MMKSCECGCGRSPAPGKRFVRSHHRRGAKQSAETLVRMREASLRQWADPEQRHRFGRPKGTTCVVGCTCGLHAQSALQRERISAAAKRQWQNPQQREVLVAHLRAISSDEISDEERAKRRESGRRLWEDPDYIERVLSVRRFQSPSRLEGIVVEALIEMAIPFEQQHRIGKYRVDFLLAPNICLEVDGEYWHSLPGIPEFDARRDAWIESQGYQVVRLAEKDVLQDARGCVASALQQLAQAGKEK